MPLTNGHFLEPFPASVSTNQCLSTLPLPPSFILFFSTLFIYVYIYIHTLLFSSPPQSLSSICFVSLTKASVIKQISRLDVSGRGESRNLEMKEGRGRGGERAAAKVLFVETIALIKMQTRGLVRFRKKSCVGSLGMIVWRGLRRFDEICIR